MHQGPAPGAALFLRRFHEGRVRPGLAAAERRGEPLGDSFAFRGLLVLFVPVQFLLRLADEGGDGPFLHFRKYGTGLQTFPHSFHRRRGKQGIKPFIKLWITFLRFHNVLGVNGKKAYFPRGFGLWKTCVQLCRILQGRHNPVHIILRGKHPVFPGRRRPQGTVVRHTHEEHPLLRAGHRDVQQTDPLRQLLPSLLPGEDLRRRRIPADPVFRFFVFQADSQLRVRQDASLPAAGQASVQPEAENHRELQSLGLMHGHDTDHVVAFRKGGGSPLVPAAGLLLNKGQEFMQCIDSAALRFFRLGAEHLQVLLRRVPGRPDAGHGQVQRIAAEEPDEGAHRGHGRQLPPLPDPLVRLAAAVPKFALILKAGPESIIEGNVLFRILQADLCQLLIRKEEGRVLQRREQRPVQGRDVDQPQQLQEGRHLQPLIEIHAAVKEDPDSPLFQQVRHLLPVAADAGHEDNDILQVIAFLQQFPDPDGHIVCGDLQAIPGFILIRFQHIHNHRVEIFKRPPGDQAHIVRIIQLRRFLRHDIPENRVGRFQDFRPGAEVRLQGQVFPFRILPCILFLPVEEQSRIRQAEPVDALFHIADHEQMAFRRSVRARRQALDNLILNAGHILALIHEDLAPALPDRGTHRLRPKDLQGIMLQVIEVQHPQLRLPLRELLRCQRCDLPQSLQRFPHVPEVPFHGLGRTADHRLQFPVDILQFFPVLFVPFLPVLLQAVHLRPGRQTPENGK